MYRPQSRYSLGAKEWEAATRARGSEVKTTRARGSEVKTMRATGSEVKTTRAPQLVCVECVLENMRHVTHVTHLSGAGGSDMEREAEGLACKGVEEGAPGYDDAVLQGSTARGERLGGALRGQGLYVGVISVCDDDFDACLDHRHDVADAEVGKRATGDQAVEAREETVHSVLGVGKRFELLAPQSMPRVTQAIDRRCESHGLLPCNLLPLREPGEADGLSHCPSEIGSSCLSLIKR